MPDKPATGKLVIGNLEICHLPALGIFNLQMRVDTGAQTSSLHVDNVSRTQRQGKPWVQFDLHPDIYNVQSVVHCSTPLFDVRRVKSSNGKAEERYVIRTPIALGSLSWPIEITLANRSDMTYLMLFGREGMGDKVLIDPSQVFLAPTPDMPG
jgi:hypothetical protein